MVLNRAFHLTFALTYCVAGLSYGVGAIAAAPVDSGAASPAAGVEAPKPTPTPDPHAQLRESGDLRGYLNEFVGMNKNAAKDAERDVKALKGLKTVPSDETKKLRQGLMSSAMLSQDLAHKMSCIGNSCKGPVTQKVLEERKKELRELLGNATADAAQSRESRKKRDDSSDEELLDSLNHVAKAELKAIEFFQKYVEDRESADPSGQASEAK